MITLTWIAAAAAVVATVVAMGWFLRFRHDAIQAGYYKSEYLSLVGDLARNPEVDDKIKLVLIVFAGQISNRKFADTVYHAMRQDFPGVDRPDDFLPFMEALSPKTKDDLKTAIVIFMVGLSYSSWAHGINMRRLINRKLVSRPEHDLQVVYRLAPVEQDTVIGAPPQPA